jgi:hypothetical protein
MSLSVGPERKMGMIKPVATLRVTEAELARDLCAVLEQVQQGSSVIIEQADHVPVAVNRSPHRSGRPIVDILCEARQRNSAVTLEEEFGKDLEEITAQHQQPLNDLMIAASAIEQGYAVLTTNVRHFEKIPGLVMFAQH